MLLTQAFSLRFTQAEVDFVIPRLDQDLPLCIDPFLLYKSRDGTLRDLHGQLVRLFNNSIVLFREGRRGEMDELIDFPEASEIGFGLRHIEELQLVSIGVAADRVSDIAANVFKLFLIDYTQKQAGLWNIPIKAAVPIKHYFDFDDYQWKDGYFDLPRNPMTGLPILLVPRRIVRLLPWINLQDYATTDYRLFLRSTAKRGWSKFSGARREKYSFPDKTEIAHVTRANMKLLDGYISRKEKESSQALPVYVDREDLGLPTRPMAEEFTKRIADLPTGVSYAKDYQRILYEILNYLFEPELTDGEMEVRTIEGTERRDIIYTNESDMSFWQYVRLNYGSPLVMFEAKNVQELEIEHINQTASYLGVRLGMLGFIVTRQLPKDNVIRKIYAVYNDTPSTPRKIILVLSDNDLAVMLRNKDTGQSPTPNQYIQRKYREFRTKVQ
jgi:hypothetical protein